VLPVLRVPCPGGVHWTLVSGQVSSERVRLPCPLPVPVRSFLPRLQRPNCRLIRQFRSARPPGSFAIVLRPE